MRAMDEKELMAWIEVNSFPAQDTHSFMELTCVSAGRLRELFAGKMLVPAQPTNTFAHVDPPGQAECPSESEIAEWLETFSSDATLIRYEYRQAQYIAQRFKQWLQSRPSRIEGRAQGKCVCELRDNPMRRVCTFGYSPGVGHKWPCKTHHRDGSMCLHDKECHAPTRQNINGSTLLTCGHPKACHTPADHQEGEDNDE